MRIPTVFVLLCASAFAEDPLVLLDDAERQIFEMARKGDVSEPRSVKDLLLITLERVEKAREEGRIDEDELREYNEQ